MSSFPPELAKKSSELQQRIERGHALEAEGKLDLARTEYWACLQMASQQKLPVIVDQMAGIWMGLGFCEASGQAFDKALEWYFRVEAMYMMRKDEYGNPVEGDVLCATLTLVGTQEVVLVIELKGTKCGLTVMESRPVKGTKEVALVSTHQESAPADGDALLELLNSLIVRGIFRKTETGLQLANPKGQIEI